MERDGFAALDRRAFLATGGRLGFWALVAGALGPARRALAAPGVATPGFPVEAASAEQRTVAALIETIVPGPATDPEIGPGALQAGALNLVYDDFYPMRAFLPAIVTLLDSQARQRHDGAAFADLGPDEREALLSEVQELLPFLRHAYRFVRAIFYADLHGTTGGRWIGFPGPNLGYVDHPEFSFREPMSEELTDDGIMP